MRLFFDVTHYKYPFIFLQIFFFSSVIYSQALEELHFSVDNGLPSNHIYDIRIDRYGYHWFATNNGVVKYNGYDFKIFDVTKGLPNNDVWNLYIDEKDKIWLGTISDELGYIYDDHYYACKNLTNITNFYPLNITSYKGIAFFVEILAIKNELNLIGIKNDTIRRYKLLLNNKILYHYIVKDRLIVCYENKIISYIFNGTLIINKNKYENNITNLAAPYGSIYYMKYLIINRLKSDFFDVIFPDGHLEKKYFPGKDTSQVSLYSKQNNLLYAYKNNYIYVYDSLLQLINIIKKPSVIKGDNVTYISEDNFWGTIIGTRENGIYEQFIEKDYFLNKDKKYFKLYSSVGCLGDSIGLWWNNYSNILKIINFKNNVSIQYKTDSLKKLQLILPLSKNKFLALSKKLYELDYTNNQFKVKNIYSSLVGPSFGLCIKNGIFYISYDNGFLRKVLYKNNSFTTYTIDNNKYTGSAYDSFSKICWFYNNINILLLDSKEKKLSISHSFLRRFGVGSINLIAIDKYENIFIKDNLHLHVFNFHMKNHTLLFENYVLANAHFAIYKNTIVLAGKFGILFSKINGPANIQNPIVYKNIKGLKYQYIDDWQLCYGKVLLKTDKGNYLVNVPADPLLDHPSYIKNDQYKVVLNYNGDKYTDITDKDSFKIDQANNSLKFDVINPLGLGKVTYKYKLSNDPSWKVLNANELVLQHLRPDKYYTLTLIAQDNAWQSDPINIQVYLNPYWWQTSGGIRGLWIGGIGMFVLTLWFAVWFTRRVINRSNEKKNLRHDLELKSIYSQINPHFIFNTLSSSLLLIQKKRYDDAYMHVSKFSRLLRAYIKSSRSKYITIEDEIANLTTYIELQQTRFKDRFDYEIITDRALQKDRIKIPALLLQPIVENAINHGLFHKKEQGYLEINFKLNNAGRDLEITVNDNGVGRKNARTIQEESSIKQESYGSDLIKDLIRIFNTYEKMHIRIKYIDKEEPETGTIVTLTITNYLYV